MVSTSVSRLILFLIALFDISRDLLIYSIVFLFSQALPNQQTVDYPSFKLVIVGDGGTGTFLAQFHLEFYDKQLNSDSLRVSLILLLSYMLSDSSIKIRNAFLR